jgi:hypothetical protein
MDCFHMSLHVSTGIELISVSIVHCWLLGDQCCGTGPGEWYVAFVDLGLLGEGSWLGSEH